MDVDPQPLDSRRFPAALLRAIGFDRVLRTDPAIGLAEIRYIARDEQTHSDGTVVQGGFVTAWLDNAMAFAVTARDATAAIATLELKVSFLDRASPGPVTAEARVVRWGRSVVFLDAELRSGDRLLARATSTAMRLRQDNSA